MRCTSLWREKTREYGIAATAKLVADSGMRLSGYCFAGLVTSPEPGERAKALDDVRAALDEAAALGAPCLVFVAGGVDARDKDVRSARGRALDALGELVPHAHAVGVKLALPPDELLIEELRTPTYEVKHGKVKVMDKTTMRELLKRSPDRADALCLTFYVPKLLFPEFK